VVQALFLFVSLGTGSVTGCRLSMHKVAVLIDTIKETPVIFPIPFYTNVMVKAVLINRKPNN